MELTGELLFMEGRYWICQEAGEWMCPLEAGDQVEVMAGDTWLSVIVQGDGYLRTSGGRRLFPKPLLPVRVSGC
jgi:hypothetical protein